MHSALMAGLDEKFHVCVHEGNSHRDGRPIGQNKVGVLAKFLDDAENIIPSTAVETGAVVTKLIYNLFRQLLG